MPNKMIKIHQLRDKGYSVSEIGRLIGMSPSRVVQHSKNEAYKDDYLAMETTALSALNGFSRS